MKIKCDSCAPSIINGTACHEAGCTGIFLYSDYGHNYRKYRVFSLDVWGNAKEGFEVNDRSERGSVYIVASLNDRSIIRALKKKGIIGINSRMGSFAIDGDDRSLYINWKKTDEPIFQLEAL